MKDKRSPDYDPALDVSVADADLTIDQYLRRQSHRAKAAIMGAAGAMKSTALDKAKSTMPGAGSTSAGAGGAASIASAPLKVIKDHPWYAVGAATAVGVLGALYFNPTRYGRLRHKLKALEKRLAEQEEKLEHAPAAGDSKAQTAAKSSILSSLGTLLLTQGLNIVKPMVAAYVEPLMAGRGQPTHNGHAPGEASTAEAATGMDPSI